MEVIIGRRHINLTPKEFEILKALKKADGRVLSRIHILTNVWGYSEEAANEIDTRKIDMCLYRIRNKIRKVSRLSASRLVTVPKHGYKLKRRNVV